MKPRPAPIALALLALLVTSCLASTSGRATLSDDRASSPPSRTIGIPSGAPPRTGPPTSGQQPPTAQSSTVPAPPATTPPTTRNTVTSADTTTEFTTIYQTTDLATGPASVIGPLDMGPNSSGYVAFQSPSGNIMCAVFDGGGLAGARCDIATWNYPAPAATQDCGQTDFRAGTARIEAEGAGVVGGCVSDTVADPNNPVLAYGLDAGLGRFGCHSAENGVTCANLETQHGFRLSRDSYQVF